MSDPQRALAEVQPHFPHWEKLLDCVDATLDFTLNLRQSGHPGGSHSKAHILIALLLSGAMRWDIRHPEKRFSDRFILIAGHTVPLVYATLACLSEVLKYRYKKTQNRDYFVPDDRQVLADDLLTLRHCHGLSGHPECRGKTLLFKFNTGPTGHGTPAALGQALALKLAGAGDIRVFGLEGEGGHTAGGNHEAKNSAWGLGTDNFYFLLDWNDYGIDPHPTSAIVHGTPDDWFTPYGWRVAGTEQGMAWESVTRVLLDLVHGPNPDGVPNCGWFKTRKGRGYGVYDAASHGVPHRMNSDAFWESRRAFQEKYGVRFDGFGEGPCAEARAQAAQTRANLQKVMQVMTGDDGFTTCLSDRLVALGEMVPEEHALHFSVRQNPLRDPVLYDAERYPAEVWARPGDRQPNRAALGAWGAWVNAYCAKKYGRPLCIASSADLAESTNIAGFAKPWGDFPGWGYYDRKSNPRGALLPMGITEFSNAGVAAGLASVNFADDPTREFNGFLAATSTYGSFIYLNYGPLRLFSQMAQDCDHKLGKILWVAGHSGPETAEDSRTHFGIMEPAVAQLFPEGKIINLFPWEYNEVPVLLAAALREDVNLIALHLTRPPITVPDREKLGIPTHFAAARGAYVLRAYDCDRPKGGVVLVNGTSAVDNLLTLLPTFAANGPNVKVICLTSFELFTRQPQEYRDSVLPWPEWQDSMLITNGGLRVMQQWVANKICAEYSLSADSDNCWRGGGSVGEVLDEAGLSAPQLLAGIARFAAERGVRLARIGSAG